MFNHLFYYEMQSFIRNLNLWRFLPSKEPKNLKIKYNSPSLAVFAKQRAKGHKN